ncbi:hypothetical protein [Carnobacterium divergens]|uniref:hypothetical protein n=1 Tax=Carnobacterium divergens TaxID=2748 RepID=UPI0010727FE9|nr:hypothetical protein [Carnobacterium divergens]
MVQEFSVAISKKRRAIENIEEDCYKRRLKKEMFEEFLMDFKKMHQHERELLEEEHHLYKGTEFTSHVDQKLDTLEDNHFSVYRKLLHTQEDFDKELDLKTQEKGRLEKELVSLQKEARP